MVEKLNSFSFKRGGGSPPRYPWAEWTDGEIYRARQGEDFRASPRAFESALRAQARKRRHDGEPRARVRVNRDDEAGAVVWQFFDDGENGA